MGAAPVRCILRFSASAIDHAREFLAEAPSGKQLVCVKIAVDSESSAAMRRPSDVEACRRTLNYRQVERLTDVVDSQLEVPGRGNYPTLKMSVRRLVEGVRRRLHTDDMAVNDIRINGGAASYIVIGDDDQVNLPVGFNLRCVKSGSRWIHYTAFYCGCCPLP